MLKATALAGFAARLTRVVPVAIDLSANNIDLFTVAGSPVVAGDYVFTISAGVVIGSASVATPSLSCSAFPPGSTVKLINLGTIDGRGGAGGTGGSVFWGGPDNDSPYYTPGGGGGPGGDAISLGFDITIDNANGRIAGGGGGGGGGGPPLLPAAGPPSGVSYGDYGGTGAGSQGTATGNGGSLGMSGGFGAAGALSGGSGGAAGKAIACNGKTVTWLGGNDATHVKGTVS